MTKTFAWAFLIALIIRLFFAYYLFVQWHPIIDNNSIGVGAGDTNSYLEPPENWIQTGVWGFSESHNDPTEPYAGRMPGYGLIYLFLRVFTFQASAYSLLIILQILVGVWSSVVFAACCSKWMNSNRVFWIVLLLVNSNIWIVYYDLRLLTESFSLSTMLLGIGMMTRAKKPDDWIWVGLAFAITVFLRPLIGFFFLIPVVYLISKSVKLKSLILLIRSGLFFMFPLLLFEAGWMLRNQIELNQWIPLQSTVWAGYKLPPIRKATYDFVQSWGGSIVFWYPNAEVRLFLPEKYSIGHTSDKNTLENLPNALIETIGLNSIIELSVLCKSAEANPKDLELNSMAIRKIEKAKQKYIQENPLDYVIHSRVRILVHWLYHSGTAEIYPKPWHELDRIDLVIKIIYSTFYIGMWLIGICGLVYFAIKCRGVVSATLLVAFAAYVAMIVIYFRYNEYRYQLHLYPLLLIGCTFAIDQILAQINNKKSAT